MGLAKMVELIKLTETIQQAVGHALLAQEHILAEGESRISSDYRFVESVEFELQGVWQRIQRYRDELPHAHPWYQQRPGR